MRATLSFTFRDASRYLRTQLGSFPRCLICKSRIQLVRPAVNVKTTKWVLIALLLLPFPECFDDFSTLQHQGGGDDAAASQDSSSVHRDVPFAWMACDWGALVERCSRWPIAVIYPIVKYLWTNKNWVRKQIHLKHFEILWESRREINWVMNCRQNQQRKM